MTDYKRWKHGSVVYPLTDDTSNTLLFDADPALYYAIELFTEVIKVSVGDRLLSQSALHGYAFPSAVEKTIHYEPTPFLLADEIVFPLFCLYRSEEQWEHHTASFEKDSSVWEWAYVLPPMEPAAIAAIHPILRSVSVAVSKFAMRSFNPDVADGNTLRDLSGIMKMHAGPVRYGTFEPAEGERKWWRALMGKLFVQEKSDFVLEDLKTFEGANISAPIDTPDGVTDAVVDAMSHLPPIIERINPASGTKAGGTPFEVLGTRMRPGTTLRVLVGGAYASNVVVTNPTRAVGVTPEHDASPTFAADVQVIDDQDNESNVLEGAFTFTTP